MERMKQQEELFYKMNNKIEENDEPEDLTVMTGIESDLIKIEFFVEFFSTSLLKNRKRMT